MPEYTKNMHLTKPLSVEKYNISIFNENADIIDEKLYALQQRDELLAEKQFVNTHVDSKENPHNVTKAQLGLSDVNNTADDEKPVSSLQRIAIDEALESAKAYADTYNQRALDTEQGILNTISGLSEKLAHVEKNTAENIYVFVNQYGIYYTYDNFNTVTSAKSGRFESVIYVEEKNVFVAIGNNIISYSSDGIDWKDVSLEMFFPTDIVYGNNCFVCSCINKIMYSTNLETWNDASGEDIESVNHRSITFANGRFIVVGDSGKSYYSTDGQAWTAMTGLDDALNYTKVIYGNDKYVCVTNNSNEGSTCYYSTDGETWLPTQCDKICFDICFGDGIFVVYSFADKDFYYSTDLDTWEKVSRDRDGVVVNFYCVDYVNHSFWLLCTDCTYYSVDGKEYTTFTNHINGNRLTYAEFKSKEYLTKQDADNIYQPKISGVEISKITYSTTEPESVEDGEIVFVYEE